MDFDETKYFLGRLCKHGHDYKGTGKSLRNKVLNNKACVECSKYVNRKKKNLTDGTIHFGKYYLGSLCARKGIEHDHENLGKCLRYISNNKCVMCQKEQVREWTRKQAKELTDYYIVKDLVRLKKFSNIKEARKHPEAITQHREYLKQKRERKSNS